MGGQRQRSVIFGTALLLLVLGAPTFSSMPTGVGELGDNGCTCHGGDSTSVSVNVLGLPELYAPNMTYNLSIVIYGPPQDDANSHQGGFRFTVTSGAVVFENSTNTQSLEDGWTHQLSGTYQRVWNFTWTPSNDSLDPVEFIVHGNAVNGNGQSSGDAWNSFGAAIAHQDAPQEPEQPVFDRDIGALDWTVFAAGLAALMFFLVRTIK